MSSETRKLLLTLWMWFAVSRAVFFGCLWYYAEMVMETEEPPLILALSFWAVIESAISVVVATIAAMNNGKEEK